MTNVIKDTMKNDIISIFFGFQLSPIYPAINNPNEYVMRKQVSMYPSSEDEILNVF